MAFDFLYFIFGCTLEDMKKISFNETALTRMSSHGGVSRYEENCTLPSDSIE